jgi:hypothetical protein
MYAFCNFLVIYVQVVSDKILFLLLNKLFFLTFCVQSENLNERNHLQDINIKLYVKEIGCEFVDMIHSDNWIFRDSAAWNSYICWDTRSTLKGGGGKKEKKPTWVNIQNYAATTQMSK